MEPFSSHPKPPAMNLSIKNVPEVLVERLRARAVRNHRSLQGELMAILEAANLPLAYPQMAESLALEAREPLTADEIWERARAGGLRSIAESTQMIREDRDR